MTGDDSGGFEIEDASEFPSIDVALEEVRESYGVEQSRKSNIEVKIGGLIAVNALLISVISAIGTLGFLTSVIVSLPALVSTGLGLLALRSREYAKPGPEPNDIFGYARRDKANSRKDFIQNYRQAIKQSHLRNNERMETLTTCFWLTGASFVLVVGAPIVEAIIQVVIRCLGL
jgi:hypothetical protein